MTAVCGLAVFCVTSARAEGTAEKTLGVQLDFNASDAGDNNGTSIDIVGGTVIVGCQSAAGTGNGEGWAQIFQKNPSATTFADLWQYQDTLTSGDPSLSASSQFGWRVGIDPYNPGLAVVSAPQNNSVYIFRQNAGTWAEEVDDRLTCSDDQFGVDVGVYNERVIVGSDADTAYVYTLGVETPDELTTATAKTSFGKSVGIYGDYAVVGDPGTGITHFYHHSGDEWVDTVVGDPDPASALGTSVSICGDYAIFGGPADDGGIGLAVVYHRDSTTGDWSQQAMLEPSDKDFYSDNGMSPEFGCSVDIGDNFAIVGTANAWLGEWESPGGAIPCGVAYVFRRDGSTWTEVEKLVPQDAASYWNDSPCNSFGSAVAVDADRYGVDYMVGAWAHDGDGAVYVHNRIPGDADCNGQVDQYDAASLSANWLRDDDVDWGDGDFNGNGIVDAEDATILAANWLYGVEPPSHHVPEPSAPMLLTFVGLGLLFWLCRWNLAV